MPDAPGPELHASDPRLEAALFKPSCLLRWLDFVGGAEFAALAPLLSGMRLAELLQVPPSGLSRLGMTPLTARRRDRSQGR